MSVVPFMQKNIFGDASAVLTRKLSEIETRGVNRIASYHDWLCLRKSDTFTLTTENQYEISGEGQDLAKVTSMWYGDNKQPLSLLYDEKAFFDQFYGRHYGSPVCCLFLEKTGQYTWKVRIYPVEEGAEITYYYQRKITTDDTSLFSNEMVFVDEILGRYLAGNKETQKFSGQFLISAEAQREEMRKGEFPVVFPERKMVISEDHENFLNNIETFRSLRKR